MSPPPGYTLAIGLLLIWTVHGLNAPADSTWAAIQVFDNCNQHAKSTFPNVQMERHISQWH
jgi:hypothetical protein